jgi:hypothetical protein
MPFRSESQRRLAYALASGRKQKKKTGMTQAVAKRLIEHDTGGKLPKHVKK